MSNQSRQSVAVSRRIAHVAIRSRAPSQPQLGFAGVSKSQNSPISTASKRSRPHGDHVAGPLADGDTVEIEVEGVGTLVHVVE
ncbi:hypothetical protein [Halomontanus rarus]|uniref:hypothetical protein n=1 Tax=Halomontanus rarus TaxID=3034020 RepID=UPI00307CB217